MTVGNLSVPSFQFLDENLKKINHAVFFSNIVFLWSKGWTPWDRIPAGARLSLLSSTVQSGYGAHPSPCEL